MLQQNIGSRLENARKSLGLTLQQAAEQTKIRSDFLAHIEKNDFDINLPEIYCQGFIRLYANYLKLDGDEIVREYRTQNNKPSFSPKKASLNENSAEESAENNPDAKAGRLSRHFNAAQQTPSEEELAWNEKSKKPELDRSFLVKFGIIFGGSLLAIVLITVVLVRFFKNGGTSENTPTALSEGVSSSNASALAKGMPAEEEVFLIATGDVHVVVRQEIDKKRLFSGTLTEGDRIPIRKRGKIKIHSSAGQNLILERNGKQYGMNAQGVATTVFE